MPNTYACKLVSNPNVPIFLPRVCTLVLFIRPSYDVYRHKKASRASRDYNLPHTIRGVVNEYIKINSWIIAKVCVGTTYSNLSHKLE